MPQYNESGYTYEQTAVRYNGEQVVSLVGSQDAASGTGNPTHGVFHITTTGNQPVGTPLTYEQVSRTYNEPTMLYNAADSNYILVRGFFHILATGSQNPASGVLSWFWNPYIWAIYTMTLSQRPESPQYASQVSDDGMISFVDQTKHVNELAGVEYRELPPNPYRKT